MKLSHSSPQSRSARGVALVIVLAMLVLLSALLVAFMSTATTERASSYANAGVSTARQIADSTVSLVISQIRDATSLPDEGVTWASQPGAIRTFSGGLSGAKESVGKEGSYYQVYGPGGKDFTFKLYSSDVMKMDSTRYEQDEDNGLAGEIKIIEDWDRLKPKKNWVDLNEPNLSPRSDKIPVGSVVEPHYPIIDPRAAYDVAEKPTNGNGIVHGFDAKTIEDQNLQMPSGGKVPYLPMPVKWLYVLRDGSIGPASRATAANPMVGRTAFWTDDDTCKLNINTASEGTFWDSPSMSLEQESGKLAGNPTTHGSPDLTLTLTSLSLAASQPIRGEYQRYPGHPATTCLSPALGWLWGPKMTAATPVWPFNADYRAFKEELYTMLPFIETGIPTTQGAFKNTDAWLNPTAPAPLYYDDASGAIKRDIRTKHLYTTVDEMLFKPERFRVGSGVPELNPKLTPEALEKLRFFLTANSRAPELNAFSRPRVTLWPVHADFENRTQFDDVFLFTSTISKGADYRRESDDVRYNIFRYDAKDDTADYSSPELFGQNIRMYEYLQDLTGRNYPGYGGTLVNTWDGNAVERDTVLNLIFDYARTVNLVDTGTAARSANVFSPYTPKFFYIPKGQPPEDYTRRYRSFDWSGQVTPLKINPGSGYQGLGRFPTISEVALVFCGATSQRGAPAMRAVLAMEMTTPMPGFPAIRETYHTRVRTIRDVQFRFSNSQSGFVQMGFSPDWLYNIPNVASHEITDGRGFMPTLGATAAFHWFPEHRGPTNPTRYPLNPTLDPNRNSTLTCKAKEFTNLKANDKYRRGETVMVYPYVSSPIETPLFTGNTASTHKFDFKGGAFEIEIWSGEAPPVAGGDPRAKLVQTFTINFPDATVTGLPVPRLSPDSPDMGSIIRFDGSRGGGRDFVRAAANGDVVRSMELIANDRGTPPSQQGDIRLSMARTVVPEAFFQVRDGPLLTTYTTASPRIHGLTVAHGDPVTGHSGAGRLVKSPATIRASKPPIVPKATNGVERKDGGPGDWDRGVSKHMSGSFGNKVDEGNLQFAYADGSPAGKIPYYRGLQIEETGQTYHAPNRQLPSPVMLGSLPTGVVRKLPWQTLLFRPDREVGPGHPGAGGESKPPEHLVLDLFHVPIVEPYAISEPFSTAGKVNLNHMIAPFGYASQGSGQGKKPYVRRDTALRGVLKSTFLTAIPNNIPDGGHTEDPHTLGTGQWNTRFPIDLDKTLAAVETRLKAKNQLFRSASEICTVDLYPAGQGYQNVPTVGTWGAFWAANGLTGDNLRERPYAHIYPRVTTKSNVYTVHMRCQAIRKSSKSDPTEFDPDKDQVVGDYRGSATIERFIDPNDIALIKYKERTEKVDPYYRYRVVNTKHFAPR